MLSANTNEWAEDDVEAHAGPLNTNEDIQDDDVEAHALSNNTNEDAEDEER